MDQPHCKALSEGAKRRALPPAMRRFVVDLKAEHPPMQPNEIATICYVGFGRRPDYRTVERILAEEPMPLRMVRRFPPYREMREPWERRMAVVRLHAEGWNVKSVASYLGTARSTVYRTLRRWIEEGVEGSTTGPTREAASGRPASRPTPPSDECRRTRTSGPSTFARRSPGRASTSARTVGRILAVNRKALRPLGTEGAREGAARDAIPGGEAPPVLARGRALPRCRRRPVFRTVFYLW